MKTIFVLDKDSDRQIQANNNLSAMGFIVRCFSSAAEFEGVNDKPFLIILDEKIGDLKKIHRKMKGVPIVYTVTKSDIKIDSDSKKAGAFEVIEKNPAEFVNLRTAIDKSVNAPVKTGWFSRLFTKKQSSSLPALSV